MKQHIVLRVVSKALIPFIMLFALYVQFHGDFGPGGGFQAGVIFAAGFVLYTLIYGLDQAQKVVSPKLLQILIPLGVLIYAGTGIYCMIKGGKFLEYNVLAHHAKEGQHLGIFVVELGVGLTVTSVITSIFFAFAGRGRS
ncbi:MAG: cation:proton antiporter [Deltaproteobacteria bacterium]|nr:cation:proton antiporter [Deltaproteobacteria bacterium]|tara:strand:+ start:786 stop:1205 length:420 start_codon:yes stop_codon:yes gene_type:complete